MARPSYSERLQTKCKHFNGLQNKVCAVGVEYASLGAPRQLPCFSEPGAAVCAKREVYTKEEADAEEAELNRHLAKTSLVMRAIRKKEGERRGVAGELDCPACTTGTVQYSIANCNGHIHARCSTKDCVSFMQ
jgi:hypothetical protein